MYNCNIPENNSLKSEIEELLKWCEKKDCESGVEDSYFEDPIEETKMSKWEEETGVIIPESYKEWLRFSEKCQISTHTATFWGPDEFNSNYVPKDLIVIGEMVGDGEVICFSRSTGEFVGFFEGSVCERYSNFRGVINEMLRMLGKVDNSKNNDDEISEMLRKLEEIRRNRNQEVNQCYL